VVAVGDDVVDLARDEVDVVAGDAGNGFDLVLDGGEGVGFGVLEHEVDLVVEVVVDVGLAEHVEFVGRCLLEHRELVQVDVGEGSELVVLQTQVFNFGHQL
jgi:hypothetical protein